MTGRIAVTAAAGTVVARAVDALSRFPANEPWVLVGGIAVFLRLGSVTRPTADADTVARSQAQLLRQLDQSELPTVITGGEIHAHVSGGVVNIDVMDLADEPLPLDAARRAFALARRAALASMSIEQVTVTDPAGTAVATGQIPLASVAALCALKTVSMVRRPNSNSPQKVGSDLHDLVRLVQTAGAGVVAAELVDVDRELARWVEIEIARAFGPDLRYTLIRLRSTDRSPAALALTDEEVTATVILADALHDQLDD